MPRFVSQETLAYLLDMSATKIDQLVSEGRIPAPENGLGDLRRWWWPQVEAAIRGIHTDNESAPPETVEDAYSAGVKRVTST